MIQMTFKPFVVHLLEVILPILSVLRSKRWKLGLTDQPIGHSCYAAQIKNYFTIPFQTHKINDVPRMFPLPIECLAWKDFFVWYTPWCKEINENRFRALWLDKNCTVNAGTLSFTFEKRGFNIVQKRRVTWLWVFFKIHFFVPTFFSWPMREFHFLYDHLTIFQVHWFCYLIFLTNILHLMTSWTVKTCSSTRKNDEYATEAHQNHGTFVTQ